MDPMLDTVSDPATLHTLAKVPTMEDLHSFGCLTPKEHRRFSEEKTEGERKERENEWPRQFPAWPDISSPSCNLVLYLCTVCSAEHGCLPDVISCPKH